MSSSAIFITDALCGEAAQYLRASAFQLQRMDYRTGIAYRACWKDELTNYQRKYTDTGNTGLTSNKIDRYLQSSIWHFCFKPWAWSTL